MSNGETRAFASVVGYTVLPSELVAAGRQCGSLGAFISKLVNGKQEVGVMKGVIGLAVFVCIVFFAWNIFFAKLITADQGKNLAIAYNEPYPDTFEIQVGIGQMVAMRDPPKSTPKGILLWKEWIAAHFELRNDAGTVIPLKRIGTSTLFTGSKGGGDPDFVLVGQVQKEADYEFDYIPVLSAGKTYRYTFKAPTDAKKKRGWRIFSLVEGA